MLTLPKATLASLLAAAAILTPAAVAGTAIPERYLWPRSGPIDPSSTLEARFSPPPGFERQPQPSGSFAAWLRGLPLKPAGAPVLTYKGTPKWRQDVHAAVVDIDVGTRDLQQCADAVMRLRAEWLLGAGRARDIAFNDTDGKRRRYTGVKDDYKAFRKYMDLVFAYAGTYSLEKELKPVALADLAIGDVFIKGGFPGHAVLVADMAVNATTGEKRFLLLQSYMPAQQMHILKNPSSSDGTPWYSTSSIGAELVTPEWVFQAKALRRWPSS